MVSIPSDRVIPSDMQRAGGFMPSIMSQSPLIGSFLRIPYKCSTTRKSSVSIPSDRVIPSDKFKLAKWKLFNEVSIPSDRVIPSDKRRHLSTPNGLTSQSPLIGSFLRIRVQHLRHGHHVKSQSPLIGSFLRIRMVARGSRCTFSLNPL